VSNTATKPQPGTTVAKAQPIDPAEYKKPTNAPGLHRLANGMMSQIKAAIPATIATNAERLVRCLLTECSRSPKLLDCTPQSLLGGVVTAAQLGLEIGGPMGQAYLLPFGKKQGGYTEAQLVIGYKGFVNLAYRSPAIKSFSCRIVRAGDTFDIQFGTQPRIVHRPEPTMTGEPIGYYAVVELSQGGHDFEYMTKAQCEQHRERYALMKNGGPWSTNFDEMALKTTIRKLAKRLPLSAELSAAAGYDEQAEHDIPQGLGMAIVVENESDPAANLRERLDAAKNPDPQYHDDEPPLPADGQLFDGSDDRRPPK